MSAAPLVREAHRLAADAHEGQARKANRMPYVEHAALVAEVLAEAGQDEEVVAAGMLHDTVEHTGVGLGEIRERFGERVAGLVEAMTDDDSIESWEGRKAEHRSRVERAGRDAASVYGADKLVGVREARDGFGPSESELEERLGNPLDLRLAVWEADLRMLERIDPPLPFLAQLKAEIAALRRDRVSPAARS